MEGISLLEKGRGFRKEKIYNLINFQKKYLNFNIKSVFQFEKNKYKINVANNEKNYKKLSVNDSFDNNSINYFLNLFAIIYFLPEMERLFIANPSSRRNFIDRLIFNYNKKYNSVINNYKKNIYERQILLKKISYEESWIQNLENNIVDFGSLIYRYRINHMEILNSFLNQLSISKNFSENFELKITDVFLEKFPEIYKIKELYLQQLKNNRKLDLYSGGCKIGPHRSDIIGVRTKDHFNINQFSTGQQKTAILLIIIAQCKYLIDILKLNPVILLDEICSHLDNDNRELLLYLIYELDVQVFMTGTDKNFFSFLSTKAHYCNIT